jgi:FkbM family methyltransferase
VVAALYAAKRRYRIGNRFLSNHPRTARAVMSLLAPVKQRSVIDVNGHRLILDSNDTLGLSIIQVYEPDVTQYARRTLRRGDVAIDVGAHIGYFTLLFAQLAGGTGQVLAFEPEAGNFDLLEQNIAANGYRNVTARRAAVGETTGRGSLLVDPFNSGGARLIDGAALGPGSGSNVEVVALDDECPQLRGRVRLVKVDAEGRELSVLRGARKTLETSSVSVVTEFTPRALEDAGTPPDELLSFLGELGFRPHLLRPDGSLELSSGEEVLRRLGRRTSTYVNLVFDR